MPSAQLLKQSVRSGGQLFALLDAARTAELPARLSTGNVKSVSLFVGERGRQLQDVSPYLAVCDGDSPVVAWLLEEGWGQSWGYFLSTDAPLAELHTHFRQLLLVQNERGGQSVFRFYDPRVLRIFLTTCLFEDAKRFFGPVCQFLVEGDTPNALWTFELGGHGVRQRVLPVTQGPEEDTSTTPVDKR